MTIGVFCGEKWYRLASWRRYPLFRIRLERTGSGFNFGPILFWQCNHIHLRCIHGDEIMQTLRRIWHSDGGEVARVRCNDCGRPMYNLPRPYICTSTYLPHSSMRR